MIGKIAVSAAVFAIDKPYSYRVPEGMELRPGHRVQVPFGRANKASEGIVLSVDNYMPNQGNTHYRMDVQGQVADYVILMGYDEHWHGSKNPGSVASIGFVSDGIEKTLKMVPAKQIINALPFYTIQWKTEGAEVTDSYVTLVNQPGVLAKVDAEPVWKEDLCQYYLEWEAGGVLNQIWLEEEESIKAKLNVMNAKKLGGVAAWRLGYGTKEIWQLLKLFKDM